MVEVIFKYNRIDTLIQCKSKVKFKQICEKFCIKMGLEINKLLFLYGGKILNLELDFNQVANQMDKENSKMIILVYDEKVKTINQKERTIKSKDIICPECGEICLINFKGFELELRNCKNNHTKTIELNEFEATQEINENEILCGICNYNNKGSSYNNKFYICGKCNKNICLLCLEKHNKEHILIDYEKKNYLCHEHNELFVSYCNKCYKNLCMQCELEHNNHRITPYREIIANKTIIKNKNKELKELIGKVNYYIDEIIKFLQNKKDKFEQYYKLSSNILSYYNMKNRNYETFTNINNIIMNHNKIISDLKNINDEAKMTVKFNQIYNLFNNKEKFNESNIIKINNKFSNNNFLNMNSNHNNNFNNLFNRNYNSIMNFFNSNQNMNYLNNMNLIQGMNLNNMNNNLMNFSNLNMNKNNFINNNSFQFPINMNSMESKNINPYNNNVNINNKINSINNSLISVIQKGKLKNFELLNICKKEIDRNNLNPKKITYELRNQFYNDYFLLIVDKSEEEDYEFKFSEFKDEDITVFLYKNYKIYFYGGKLK